MSVTVQAIPQEASATTLQNVNEFYVPNILAFNLKKKSEDRLQTVETDSPRSRQNGDPFLSPVEHTVESSKENPVLNALLRGKTSQSLSQWSTITRTSLNNCHPFKRTELSHDLYSDDTPVQVPRSLIKKPSGISKQRKARSRSRSTSPLSKTTILKEICMNSDLSITSAPGITFSKSGTINSRGQSPDKGSPHRDKDKDIDLSIFSKRKKITSQSTISTPKQRLQYVNNDRLVQLRSIVDNAIKNHKVYSMMGCYNSVRNALKQRGWIEKIDNDVKGRRKVNKYEEIGLSNRLLPDVPILQQKLHPRYPPADPRTRMGSLLSFVIENKYQTVAAMRLSAQTNSGFAHSDQIRYTGQGEAEIMNRMLRNVTEDLCWLSRPYPYYCWKDFDKFEMVNRLPRAYFSNKLGLCNTLQQIQWFYEAGVCSTKFPRTYNMSTKEEIDAFKEDYRLTACIGLLKWFLNAYKNGGEKAVRSPEGKVDMNVIEFSLRRCAEYVKTRQHEDIDILDTPNVWEYQWDQFITQYYRIINEGQILRDDKDGVSIKAVVSNVRSMLNILKPYWPEFDTEGHQNFWIVKPGGRCCGAGIVIRNNIEQILIMVNPNSMRETRFIVQKYIERPLLIYNTKFDIRQWFLVTNVYPLTIWMYKESYLRFCSQPFTLKSTHESIHLCNNAVQRKYKNGKRDRGLPEENMWDCYTFQTYLKAIGHPDAWEKHIYPGMKEGFIGALLASQDSMERKKNCFELYGADFMISDTLTDGPWLIEINSNPAMDSSTSVTARLCPQVLEDIIKVVIDRRDNKSAPTGAFEMVFRQNCPPIPSYLGINLCVKGKKAYKSSAEARPISRKSKTKKSIESVPCTDTEEESTLEDFFSISNSPKVPDLLSKEETNPTAPENPITPENPGKSDTPDTGKETGIKRRKVDWVKKNIEDLKSIQSNKGMKISPATNASQSPSPTKDTMDEAFKEQVLKLLGTVEMNEFLQELRKLKRNKEEIAKKEALEKKQEEVEDLKIGAIKATEKNPKAVLGEDLEESEISETLKKLVNFYRERADRERADGGSKEHCDVRAVSKFSAQSCPNFDSAFVRELEAVEEKPERSSSMDSQLTYFSAEQTKSGSKTSLEYFIDWKTTLYETRKTCEDLLAQLQLFQEANSKVKFQEAVKKRMNDEVEFVKRIKQRRKFKERTKIKKEEKDVFEGKEKTKMEDFKSASKFWPGATGLTPLAINSENGAVRNISYSLPKIKQRSRPLLPNGSSDHGRKIDAALQQTCCH